MRLGLLSFADALASPRRLADALESAGHYVVLAEKPAASGVAAAEEAARLARADCDGAIFLFDGTAALETVPGLVVQAALHAACPVLLAGDDLPALLAASGALEEIGLTPGRAFGPPDDATTLARLQAWAHLHDPAERRRGQDAAGKLFGSRYALFGDPSPDGVFFDAARWLTQFGVHVQHAGAGALAGRSVRDYCAAEGVAFCSLGRAADGGPLTLSDAPPVLVVLPAACGADGALTVQLLSLLAAGDDAAVSTLALAGPDLNSPDRVRVQTVAADAAAAAAAAAATMLTFARITRRLGRFVCLLVTGTIEEGALLRPDCGVQTLLSAAAAPYLHAAPGDLRAALKAACETLDVEPILLV